MKDISNKKHGKNTRIVLISIGCFLLVGVVGVLSFFATTFSVDKSLIIKNEDYNVVVVESDYTSLAKVDQDGNYLDDDFVIQSFSDLHLDIYQKNGNVTIEMLIKNIVSQKPDLVVFVGDNVTHTMNAGRARQLGRVMEDLGVYWTCVLGNHEGDNILSITRQSMVDIFASYPHCLMENDIKITKNGETVSGAGNHVINLLNSDSTIRQSLYFIDGGSDISKADKLKYEDEIINGNNSKYDYVKESQIEWYKETVAAINTLAGKTVKSIIFDHIPLNEFDTAYEKALLNEKDAQLLSGIRLENVCASGHNNGFFDVIVDLGSTQAFISGHDHINDYVVEYKGVKLAYNRCSGYSSYNLITEGLSDTLLQGYSVYTMDKNGGFLINSYLNADLYPAQQADIVKLYKSK